MKSFEYTGIWWIPENPDKKVTGTVTFDQEKGIELSLIGSFYDARRVEFKNHPIIFGIPATGKPITLQNCLMTKHTSTGFSAELGGSSRFIAHTAYIGAHFSSIEEFQFNKVAVTYTHLTDWVAYTSGIKPKTTYDEESLFKENIAYDVPDTVEAKTSKGSINLYCNTHFSRDIHKYSINETFWLELQDFGTKSLEEIRNEFIHPLGTLISFLTDKYNSVEELIFYSEEVSHERNDGETIREPIQVFYPQRFYYEYKAIYAHDMILHYEQVSEDLQNIFENWLTKFDQLDAVFNAYFWVQGMKRTNSVEKFMTIARAVEVYHRRRKTNEVLPKDEHAKMKDEIVSAVPESYRKWLKEKLAFSNEPTLKNRVRELINDSSDVMFPLINNEDRFIKIVGDSRNYYTHYNEDLREKAATGFDLLDLSEVLLFLIKSCILNELGIPIEKQVDIFSRNEKYNFIKSKERDKMIDTQL